MRAFARKALEVRQRIESEIHFAGRTAEFVAVDVLDKIRRKMFRTDHSHEGQSRIDTRRYNLRSNLLSALEHNTLGLTTFNDDAGCRRFHADFCTCLARSTGNRVGDGSRASPYQTP